VPNALRTQLLQDSQAHGVMHTLMAACFIRVLLLLEIFFTIPIATFDFRNFVTSLVDTRRIALMYKADALTLFKVSRKEQSAKTKC
jgi:hypothetical protein